jgi:hypothetical protein
MSSTVTTKRMDRQSIEFTGNVVCHSSNNAKGKEEALRTKVLNAMPSSGATDDNSAATTQMAQSEAALILPRVRSKWLKIYRDELGRNGHRQKEITVPSMMNQCFNIGSIFFSSWMVLRSVAE